MGRLRPSMAGGPTEDLKPMSIVDGIIWQRIEEIEVACGITGHLAGGEPGGVTHSPDPVPVHDQRPGQISPTAGPVPAPSAPNR